MGAKHWSRTNVVRAWPQAVAIVVNSFLVRTLPDGLSGLTSSTTEGSLSRILSSSRAIHESSLKTVRLTTSGTAHVASCAREAIESKPGEVTMTLPSRRAASAWSVLPIAVVPENVTRNSVLTGSPSNVATSALSRPISSSQTHAFPPLEIARLSAAKRAADVRRRGKPTDRSILALRATCACEAVNRDGCKTLCLRGGRHTCDRRRRGPSLNVCFLYANGRLSACR